MIEDEKREYRYEHRGEHWLRTLGIILATLIGAFLAFYVVSDIRFNRMMDPVYQMRKMEKMMQREEKSLMRLDDRFGENPFEPKLAPMLVNLVKEPGEYKVIVDLKPIGGSEKNVNVKLEDNVVTVSGEVERKERNREDITSFSQSYYLDEKLDADRMTKERKGNKYVITIPYVD